MKYKILTLIYLFCVVLAYGQSITLTTTSNSASWSPTEVRNSGATALRWQASNSKIGTITRDINDPTFNFSANDGSPISITITSSDGLSGLTRLYVIGLEVSYFNVSEALNLREFSFSRNNYSSIPDFSLNNKLTRLYGFVNSYGSIDISNNPNLDVIYLFGLPITNLNIDNNPKLKYVSVWNNQFTPDVFDYLVKKLDEFGVRDGYLYIRDERTIMSELTQLSSSAFKNLKNKGWLIDIPQINITGLGTTIPGDGSNVPISSDGTDFGSAEINGTVIKRTFTIENAAIHNNLRLTDPSPYIKITGDAGFSLSVLPTSEIGEATDIQPSIPGTTTFEITFNPQTVGERNALVSVKSNDPYQSNYVFNIQAEVSSTQADTEVPVAGIMNTPTNITQNAMTLSWSAGTDNVGVTNYKIYKNGVLETQVGNVLTYAIAGLIPNTNYNFHITALDAAGLESSNSNTVQGTTLPAADTEVPVAGIMNTPTNITQNAMTLSWSAGTDNVGVTNYKIYKNGVLETQVGNVLTYAIAGLIPNTNYNFHITALDAAGLESSNSNTVQGTTLPAPVGNTITLTTSSSNAAWSPQTVTKSGGILTWTATGTGLAGSPVVINANDPTFNFSSNNGSPIIIKVTSPDGFNGLTALDLWVAPSGGLIASVDLTNAAALTLLNTRYNPLTGLNINTNTALKTLILRGNRQLNNQALNIGTNTQLTYLQIDGTGINSVDLSNNKLLKDVRLYDARLTSVVLDKVLIDLDEHGLSNGNLRISSQTTGQSITSASYTAYNSLKAKGWTIDVAAPQADTEVPVAGIMNTPTNITQNAMTLSWSAGTDNVGVTNYKIYKNGVLETQVGNVLTYAIAGLIPNTNYNFHITALDAAGLESSNSNTVQGTTLPAADTEVPVAGIMNTPTNITQNAMTLSWSAGTDNVGVTNYKIYKNGVLETQVGNVLTYAIAGLIPNTNYNFHITALDAAGLESSNSNTVQGTTLPAADTEVPVAGIMNTPTNITQNAMTLSWSAGTDNVGVTNYKIYKNGVLETQVGNVLTYAIAGLIPNTNYNFHITALDAAGLESSNSNTVQGTTLPAPVGNTITLTTSSSNAAWSPQTVTKSGGILTWTATGTGLAGSPVVINANDPTFNFSSNNGSPIIIKVTSPDGFNGLTALDLWVAPSGGLIASVDLTNAAALTLLNTRYNPLTGLNINTNTALKTLILRGNRQLNNQALNIGTNTQLTYLQIDGTGINSVDLSNNKLLKDVRLYDARLTSVVLDKVLIDLDEHGLSNGNLRISSQTTGQSITSASYTAYNSLKAKGWTIDVAAPPTPILMKGAGKTTGLDGIIHESVFRVFNLNDGFNISSNMVVKELKMYDLFGRILLSSKPNQSVFYLDANFLKNGSVYIIQVMLENGSVMNKKAIKL